MTLQEIITVLELQSLMCSNPIKKLKMRKYIKYMKMQEQSSNKK